MSDNPKGRLDAQLNEIGSAATGLSVLAQDSLKGPEGESCSYFAARITEHVAAAYRELAELTGRQAVDPAPITAASDTSDFPRPFKIVFDMEADIREIGVLADIVGQLIFALDDTKDQSMFAELSELISERLEAVEAGRLELFRLLRPGHAALDERTGSPDDQPAKEVVQ